MLRGHVGSAIMYAVIMQWVGSCESGFLIFLMSLASFPLYPFFFSFFLSFFFFFFVCGMGA
jgi:hypothetical protein